MIAVCGPTASGKSDLADEIAELLSNRDGAWTPTIAVDSMQVYKEIPVISNQKRRRAAELIAVASVTEEWNVARHLEAADAVMGVASSPQCVLDAGTGMYLNTILTDLNLAPRVSEALRLRAADTVAIGESAGNRRREVRKLELSLAGAEERASVWGGAPRFETVLIFLRPPTDTLSIAIDKRTKRIVTLGVEEVSNLRAMELQGQRVTPQVRNAIGIREMNERIDGALTEREASERIATRTRDLAKRQIRWFDKLAHTLKPKPNVHVLEYESPKACKYYMRDIVR